MARFLVTGSSGLIGTALVPSLTQSGDDVVRMSRGPERNLNQVSWDPLAPVKAECVSGFDHVIHLAGESVVGRWTAEKKKRIRESRVLATQHLARALSQAQARPKTFICASAIGIYGDRGDEVLTEASEPGQGFAADLGRDWEAAAQIAATAGIRTVNLRIGLVLSSRGGALKKMLLPFKLGLGGRLGSGGQWWSWIHVEDTVGAIHHVLQTESLVGAVNAVAPNPVTNREFTRVLASVLHRPALFPMPAFAARLAFGEMANELMLSSQRVAPAKLQGTGYRYHFPELSGALQDLTG